MNIEIESLWYQTKLFFFGTLNLESSLSWLATSLSIIKLIVPLLHFQLLNVLLSMSQNWSSKEHQLNFFHLWKCGKLQYWVWREYSPFPCLSCESFCCIAWGILTNSWLCSHGSWRSSISMCKVQGFFSNSSSSCIGKDLQH